MRSKKDVHFRRRETVCIAGDRGDVVERRKRGTRRVVVENWLAGLKGR